MKFVFAFVALFCLSVAFGCGCESQAPYDASWAKEIKLPAQQQPAAAVNADCRRRQTAPLPDEGLNGQGRPSLGSASLSHEAAPLSAPLPKAQKTYQPIWYTAVPTRATDGNPMILLVPTRWQGG